MNLSRPFLKGDRMKIAIMSDSHDNIWKLEAALEKAAGSDAIIHCGDLCSPFIIDRLGRLSNEKPVHVVWGNNEGDIRLMCRLASGHPHIELHGPLAELDYGGIRIGVSHYPEIARPMAKSGQYDLVCYGHDHTAHCSKVGDCTLTNPGELMGMKGQTTIAFFDTESREVEHVDV